MPDKCQWWIGPGVCCGKEARRRHCLPQQGETFATATGEKVWACSEHHYRKPRVSDQRMQVFRDDEQHTAL